MSSFDVTRKARTLGARDDTTGWCSSTWVESTIKGSFDATSVNQINLPIGIVPHTKTPFITSHYMRRGDHLVNAFAEEYQAESDAPVRRGNEFIYNLWSCSRIIKPADRAATSGTWHVDSESVKTDPRNRMKTWLETYVSYTAADELVMFAGQDYPIEYEFIDNGFEVVVALDIVESNPVVDYEHKPYKFDENTTLHCYALDTATLTATNILENYEQAVRDAATDNFSTVGSLRDIITTKPDRVDIGGMWLWHTAITVMYTRQNDDYTPTYPTVTWGPSAAATGTFTFPNVVRRNITYLSNNQRLNIPGRLGGITQKLGLPDYQIDLTCDLDVSPPALTWKRPQTTSSKTDVVNEQVFLDIWFNGQLSGQTYQTMNLGWGSTIQVILDEVHTRKEGDSNMLDLTFYGYASTGGSAYKTTLGISP